VCCIVLVRPGFMPLELKVGILGIHKTASLTKELVFGVLADPCCITIPIQSQCV
jgi:hypothetical protein